MSYRAIFWILVGSGDFAGPGSKSYWTRIYILFEGSNPAGF